MTALDILVILLMGGGMLLGFVRGFIHEVFTLAAWVSGIVALKFFHEDLSLMLEGPVGTPTGAMVLAFALLFLPAFVIVRFLGSRLGRRTRRSLIGPVDRLLGGGFGMIKGLIAATLLFVLANFATDFIYGPAADRPAFIAESTTFPLLNASRGAMIDWVEEAREEL